MHRRQQQQQTTTTTTRVLLNDMHRDGLTNLKKGIGVGDRAGGKEGTILFFVRFFTLALHLAQKQKTRVVAAEHDNS